MEEKAYQHFWDLEVWKAARAFKMFTKDVARGLPGEERLRLTDQMIRSSRSVGTQISEGYGRYTPIATA